MQDCERPAEGAQDPTATEPEEGRWNEGQPAEHDQAKPGSAPELPPGKAGEVGAQETAGTPAPQVAEAPGEVELAAKQKQPGAAEPTGPRRKRRKRQRRKDAWEAELQGRRDLCYTIPAIAPRMLKMVMTRVASSYLKSTKGLTEQQLKEELVRGASQIADRARVKNALLALDPQRDRRLLKGIIIFDVLMEQERYALPSKQLAEQVLAYEGAIVKETKSCKLLDPKAMEKTRLFAYETYNVVLDAAWRHEDRISVDEANLLSELRRRLNITLRDHRLLEAKMGRFPKRKCVLHSIDEIEDAKRQLQKEGLLWTFRDEDGTDIDAVPAEIMEIIRSDIKVLELQAVNFGRLLDNKAWSNPDLRRVLEKNGLDRHGNRAEKTERILGSRLTPSQVLGALGLGMLQALCREVGLVSYGTKDDIIARLIGFYDNLTFEPIVDRDQRAQWYAVYELLAARKYSELKAHGLIDKQEDVDRAFERATDFLFEKRLNLSIEKKLPVKAPDGKVYLPRKQVVLWDCKSNEREVNLQDHLEPQFDGYMRTEAREGYQVLYFLVIGPRFTARSLVVARKYKMATNWDVPMITAGALKRIAEKWHAAKQEQPFPTGLLNLTDLIDDGRADELLSVVL